METTPLSEEQTKKCPKCGETIQATAKVCKHCKVDLRNWFVKHKIMTGLMVFIVLMIIISVDDSKNEKINNIPTSSDNISSSTVSNPNISDSTSKAVSLKNNDPSIKQLGTLTADYTGKSFVLNVNAKTSDYYNYGFDDATKYYSLSIWDNSVSGSYDGIYAYVDKNDTNKQLVNALLDSDVQLEVHASIPTNKWTSGSNAFMKIDSWKLLK